MSMQNTAEGLRRLERLWLNFMIKPHYIMLLSMGEWMSKTIYMQMIDVLR